MFIDKDSIVVNGVSMGPYIVEAKYGYHKLWGPDTGRNLAGSQSGTFVGIFPKITLQFRKLTRTQLETITPILDSPSQSLTYYDPTEKKKITMTTYTNDYEVTNNKIIKNNSKNSSFSCAFISKKRRGTN